MVCIFCIAVLALVAGAVTAERLDQVEDALRSKATDGQVRRAVDSSSVARFELTVPAAGRNVPVAVTVFKDHRRVRIQILMHELRREDIEQLEDELAKALDAEIVDRSDPEYEASAQHLAEHEHEAEHAERQRERGRQRAGGRS